MRSVEWRDGCFAIVETKFGGLAKLTPHHVAPKNAKADECDPTGNAVSHACVLSSQRILPSSQRLNERPKSGDHK